MLNKFISSFVKVSLERLTTFACGLALCIKYLLFFLSFLLIAGKFTKFIF